MHMRNTLPLWPFLFATHALIAQRDHRIEVDPGIGHVTIYLNGGEVRTAADLDLKAGRNVVVLKGLSPHTWPQSVQTTIRGDLEILSVSTAGNFLDPGKLDPRIDVVKDSVALLEDRIAELDDRMSASEAEKEMLASNHDIGGAGVVVGAEQLAKAADFFRERTLLVNKAISKLRKEQAELREQLARSRRQLSELNYRHDPNRKDVTIVLIATKALKTRVDLRYLVANTGWSPVYDLVAKDITRPVLLRYKAQVYNNTGIDWNNVGLTLSTADPSLGASQPVLSKWTLGNEPNERLEIYGHRRFDQNGAFDAYESLPGAQLLKTDTTQKYEEVTVSEVSAEFPIVRPYDIPNDAKPYLVDIAEHTIDATYSYVAIPKIDKDAFLLARIAGWEKYDLVDGKANVYYGDTYVGESTINTSGTDDTLDLSLGRDNNVQISRVQVEDKTSHKVIGSDRKAMLTFEITVKNNGSAPLALKVLDQVPISEDSDIRVEVLETSKARLDEKEGTVEWLAQLAPGASQKYTLSFSIRYPKWKEVKYRSRMRRQKITF